MNPDAPPLHRMLDWEYVHDEVLRCLDGGADPNLRVGPCEETALHVAVRRRRVEMIEPLVRAGAEIEARTAGGKTPWVHAFRRGFDEVAEALNRCGARRVPGAADELAAALTRDDLAAARVLLGKAPGLAQTDNPEESRVLPDITGHDRVEGITLLLDHGAPIDARGLDGGTALHQAAWFGAPGAAGLLIDRGASVDIRGDAHDSSPLGWVCHGSRWSGGAAERGEIYAEIAGMLLAAGASYAPVMYEDAAEPVREVLRSHGHRG